MTALRGRFVVLEGTDGAGTTTQGDLLAQAIRRAACGEPVVSPVAETADWVAEPRRHG